MNAKVLALFPGTDRGKIQPKTNRATAFSTSTQRRSVRHGASLLHWLQTHTVACLESSYFLYLSAYITYNVFLEVVNVVRR